MTRLELAAIRLHKATQADRERSRKMSALACERECSVEQAKPCWKPIYIPGRLGENLGIAEYPSIEYVGGESESDWCQSCQARQKLYLDKSVRKELGNAKRSFWAATKAMLRELQGGYL